MLPGYNHNICYKGQVFHIQTEDSGVEHPHVITLLFVKGNIIARKKKDYQDILSFDRLDDAVRELMQDQHKDMLRELKGGKYDSYLGGAPTKEDQTVCEAPPAPAPAPARAPQPAPPAAPGRVPVAPPLATRPAAPKPIAPQPPPPTPTARPPAPQPAPRPAPPAPAPMAVARPAAPRPAAPAPPPRPAAPPPPPAAVPEPEIMEKPASKTITLSEDVELKDEDIFGADMISDRSLDEVILSFLSKQMDEDEE